MIVRTMKKNEIIVTHIFLQKKKIIQTVFSTSKRNQCTFEICFVDLKYTVRYFSSKHALFQDRQNCSSGSADTGSLGSPVMQGRENTLTERRGRWEALVNKRFVAFHWRHPYQEGKSSSCWAPLSLQGLRAPPSGLPILFNQGSCSLTFTILIKMLLFSCQPARLLCRWDSPVKETEVGCHFLLQGSSQPRDQTHISHVTAEPPRKLLNT